MDAVLSSAWGLSLDHVEDVNRRTRHSMQFRRSDGKRVSLLSSNLYYQARPGEWEPPNLNFQLRGGNYYADRNWFHTQVSNSGIEVLDPETHVGLRWITPQRLLVTGRQASLTADGVAWSWSIGPRRLKLDGLVTSPQGPRTYEFQYEPLGAGQDFTIVNGAAITPGILIHAPIIIGADGESYLTTGWRMLPGPRLAFDFDDSVLPPSAFPYVIDPTTILQPGAGGFDCYGRSDSADITYNDSSLSVGDISGGSVKNARFLIKFDVSGIGSDNNVSDATLMVYETSAADTAGTGTWDVDVHRLFRDWVEAEATWNSWKTSNTWGTAMAGNTSSDRTATKSATVSMDGTAANAYIDFTSAQLITDVQNFVDGGQSNYGWIVQAPSAENAGAVSRNIFASSDDVSNHPKLVVVHSAPPSVGMLTMFGVGR